MLGAGCAGCKVLGAMCWVVGDGDWGWEVGECCDGGCCAELSDVLWCRVVWLMLCIVCFVVCVVVLSSCVFLCLLVSSCVFLCLLVSCCCVFWCCSWQMHMCVWMYMKK